MDGAYRRRRRSLRWVGGAAWIAAVAAFWASAQRSDVGAFAFLLSIVEGVVEHPWAPAIVLAGYLLRPVLLIPITVLNLSAGFAVGVPWGFVVGALGTWGSSTVGYLIGTTMADPSDSPGGTSATATSNLVTRFAGLIRRRGFESVVAGGLMYLHADAVNFPAGALRVRFPVFLAGVTVGNALTMSSAVLAGASIDGSLSDARLTLDPAMAWTAGALLVSSVVLATWLRRRSNADAGVGDEANGASVPQASNDATNRSTQ